MAGCEASDAEVVGGVLGGDRQRYAVLVSRHERAVMATALAVLRDGHAAQDAAQVAFVAAYRALATLRNRRNFGAWVLVIARREALRMRRRRVPAAVGVDGNAVEAPVEDGGDPELLAAVAALPEQERVVVALHYFEGMAVAEVGRALGRPVGTVTKQLSRAHARLREILQQRERA